MPKINPDQCDENSFANKIYVFDRRKLRSPLLFSVALLSYIFAVNDWLALLGVPLIYLSWVACSPNLHLVDGFLPIVAALVTAGLGFFWGSSSLLISGLACGFTWVAASIEAAFRLELLNESSSSANNVQHQ